MSEEREGARQGETPTEWPALDPPGLVLRLPLEPHGRSWPPATLELQCRATDTSGRSQPITGARNAIHSVRVKVEHASETV
jgi:hypothetical protein